MTETNLKISFAELSTVRIECPDCGTNIDMPIAKLHTAGLSCPCCGVALRNFGNTQHMQEFARSFQALQSSKPAFSFVMPVEQVSGK